MAKPASLAIATTASASLGFHFLLQCGVRFHLFQKGLELIVKHRLNRAVVVRSCSTYESSSSDTIELFIAEFRELIDAEHVPMIFGDGHHMLR